MQTCSAERQTHSRPARRPPQHSHHSALATAARARGSDQHPLHGSPQPSRSYRGWGLKELQATISSRPLQLQQGPMMDLQLGPALQRHPLPESGAFLQHTPSRRTGTALPVECQGKPIPRLHSISTHRAQLQLLPALSGTLSCRAESQSPLSLCNQRCKERQSAPCGKQNEVIYAWELQETPNLSVQSTVCSASSTSKTDLEAHKQRLERDRTDPCAVG